MKINFGAKRHSIAIWIICFIVVIGVYQIVNFSIAGLLREPQEVTYNSRTDLDILGIDLEKEVLPYVDYFEGRVKRVLDDYHQTEEYKIKGNELDIEIFTNILTDGLGVDITLTKNSDKKTMTYYYESFGSNPEKVSNETLEALAKLSSENRDEFKAKYNAFVLESDGNTLLKELSLNNGTVTFSYVKNTSGNILTIEIIQNIDL